MLTRWCVAKENQAALASIPNVTAADMSRSAEDLSPPQQPSPAPKAVDQDLLAETREVMGDQFSVILEFFLEDAAQYLDQIVTGLASKDASTIAKAAHPLKSSSREMGASELSSIVKEIEEWARSAIEGDGDLVSIEPLVDRLRPSFNEVKSQLETVIAQGALVDSPASANCGY